MSNKHDANVRKSTLVNFQIGLMASLLFAYVLLEVRTAKPVHKIAVEPLMEEQVYAAWDEQFQVYEAPKPKTIAHQPVKRVVDPVQFQEVDDDTVLEKMVEEFTNEQPEATPVPFDANALAPVDDLEDEPEHVPFAIVEDVPVFPGCETLATKREKAACFSEKIGRIISRKFNTELGSRYGLSGVQRIYTTFDVGVDGAIRNVKVRAPHPKLEKEAKRVIGFFPTMTPGMQRKKPVTVKYQLPIVFKVEE